MPNVAKVIIFDVVFSVLLHTTKGNSGQRWSLQRGVTVPGVESVSEAEEISLPDPRHQYLSPAHDPADTIY